MSYGALAQLKDALRLTDDAYDDLLSLALEAAKGLIDNYTGRTFLATEAVETRSFPPLGGRVETDDIATTEGLIVTVGGVAVPAEVAGVSPGYRLEPHNAAALGEPWTTLTMSGGGWPFSTSFYSGSRLVDIAAHWGFSVEPPDIVIQAELLQASRLFSRRQSPYGVAGSPEVGTELRLLAKVDPDVAVLLQGLVRYEVV